MPTTPKLAGKQAAQVHVTTKKKTAPRKTAPRNVAASTQEPPKTQGVFARLKAEAEAERAADQVLRPYLIDDVDPPIVVPAPETADQVTALGELLTSEGKFANEDARRVLAAICGHAFPALWELVRDEHITVLLALIRDIGDHFEKQALLLEADDFPGGSGASSA